MARSSTYPNVQGSPLRNLKVLVVVLAASNILVGALGFHLLRSVDQRYSELLGRSVPALNDLRELMSDAVTTMRATNPRNYSGAGADAGHSIQMARQRLEAEQKFRAQLLNDPAATGNKEDHAGIQQLGDEFERMVSQLTQAYGTADIAEVTRQRDEKLLPAFDEYLAAIARAADRVEAASLSTSKDYTVKTNTLSAIVLSVASSPLIVLGLLLLVTAIFVVVMMVAFRGKDLADAP